MLSKHGSAAEKGSIYVKMLVAYERSCSRIEYGSVWVVHVLVAPSYSAYWTAPIRPEELRTRRLTMSELNPFLFLERLIAPGRSLHLNPLAIDRWSTTPTCSNPQARPFLD